MSKPKRLPEGLPPVAVPIASATPPKVAEPELVVEEEKYQLEQETVPIVLAKCPRCGSTERSPLKEISPRIYTSRGCLIRYRTTCRGKINPVGKDGKPVVDEEGNPVYYECGNRYKAKALVSNDNQESGKAAS